MYLSEDPFRDQVGHFFYSKQIRLNEFYSFQQFSAMIEIFYLMNISINCSKTSEFQKTLICNT